MEIESAITHLNLLFSLFPEGEKYFVDLSGKGEPLLALGDILRLADWCHRKQDEIGKEILVQFVCNGTLLSSLVAETLQKHGILFGVSLDGYKSTHDAHRKTKEGKPTFDWIIKNVSVIEHRDYVGCAGTITRDVFPLLETIRSLMPLFKTISFRPARGDMRIDSESAKRWQEEYERLAYALYEDSLEGDDSMFLTLMNGDDYFGRFLCRAFGGQIVLNRCDGGISRFSIDTNGAIYACPADSEGGFPIDGDLRQAARAEFERQSFACLDCPFKFLCGGECPIELRRIGKPWKPMCDLKQKMIVLANWLELRLAIDRPEMHERLKLFVEEKMSRYRKDPELERFMKGHTNLSFTEAKRLFDELNKRY